MTNKVYIVNPSYDYYEMFLDKGWEIVNRIEDADMLQFTGGEDVHPSYYGEALHPRSSCNSVRDQKEQYIFEEAIVLGLPMAGICRGSQFLNVMCGGKMFQHVEGHLGNHPITDVDSKRVFTVTSTHHQMMRSGKEGQIVAFANQKGKREYMDNGNIITQFPGDAYVDPEVIFYPTQRCLCFQPHPEFKGSWEYLQMTAYYFDCLQKYLFALTVKGEV